MVDSQPLLGYNSTMYQRQIMPRLLEALSDTPVVLIHGERQTGKSTLLRELAAGPHPVRCVTLDDATTLAGAAADPAAFIAGFEGPMAIDEVQRAPGLFLAIKAAVDRNRQPGRFILAGSANVMLLPRIAESLAGRMEILALYPLSEGEIRGRTGNLIDPLFHGQPPLVDGSDPGLMERVLTGGFPEALSRAAPRRRRAWFDSYLTALLERDVRDLSNIEGLVEMPRLLSLLAARLCGLLNLADISRSSGIPQTTLKRYLALLETTFLVQMLPAWSNNLGSRVTKSPKMLLNDTGLASHLLGLQRPQDTVNHPLSGALLECFVDLELRKQAVWCETQVRLYHFRTDAGQEVDLVLERADGAIVGIEVKSGASVTASDFKGLRFLQQQLGARFQCGVVLSRSPHATAFGPGLWALPVDALWAR